MLNFLIPRVYAAKINLGLPLLNGQAGYNSFNEYLAGLITLISGIAMAGSVIVLIYAAIVYAQSGGQADRISFAKELVSGVFVGLTILLLTRLIYSTLGF